MSGACTNVSTSNLPTLIEQLILSQAILGLGLCLAKRRPLSLFIFPEGIIYQLKACTNSHKKISESTFPTTCYFLDPWQVVPHPSIDTKGILPGTPLPSVHHPHQDCLLNRLLKKVERTTRISLEHWHINFTNKGSHCQVGRIGCCVQNQG